MMELVTVLLTEKASIRHAIPVKCAAANSVLTSAVRCSIGLVLSSPWVLHALLASVIVYTRATCARPVFRDWRHSSGERVRYAPERSARRVKKLYCFCFDKTWRKCQDKLGLKSIVQNIASSLFYTRIKSKCLLKLILHYLVRYSIYVIMCKIEILYDIANNWVYQFITQSLLNRN